MAETDPKPLDGSEKHPDHRKKNVVFENKDAVFLVNLAKDVAAGNKRFVGFYKDEETGELVEATSQRRIMPRYM